MTPTIKQAILNFTGASSFTVDSVIQTLWSGYGEILRLRLTGAAVQTVVVKYVCLPDATSHPRGWNTPLSHQRKVRSYQVESRWYEHFAAKCDDACRVPKSLGVLEADNEFVMVLEDLDAAGFATRIDYGDAISEQDVLLCVTWLANFHARFLKEPVEGLWPVGSYWHLATRPDEWAAMPEGELKNQAANIDKTLNNASFKTLVHGDAKLANFCFADDKSAVAAVDFQYVGAGCGIKDLAYFLSSCLDEEDCARLESKVLASYFSTLENALGSYGKALSPESFAALEDEWRTLYPLAWADFYRFLQGWSPEHWKIHRYSEAQTQQALLQLPKA